MWKWAPSYNVGMHFAAENLVAQVDLFRLESSGRLDPKSRSEHGQFFTPSAIAGFMATMLRTQAETTILDPGAGVGSLTAAAVVELVSRKNKPQRLKVICVEREPLLIDYLRQTIALCEAFSAEHGVTLEHEVISGDFIQLAVAALRNDLLSKRQFPHFNAAILNPPYSKLNSDSLERKVLRSAGIETSNFYSAFVWLTAALLEKNGQLVAITPRSFCNGPYFKPFRKALIETAPIEKLHVFESREEAFSDDTVLQENVIFSAIKTKHRPTNVQLSSGSGPDSDEFTMREVPWDEFIYPNDPDLFVHLKSDDTGQWVSERMAALPETLSGLGLEVSTGRVVDFRAAEFLLANPTSKSVPLLYPVHLGNGIVDWPKPNQKKPKSIEANEATQPLFVPKGAYVLVKRFSSKEERRRVVAAYCGPEYLKSENFAFENHINFFHSGGRGLEPVMARGLTVFLNSTLVDMYFRLFNGHTQVNATDLRKLSFPAANDLHTLGQSFKNAMPSQVEIDSVVQKVLFSSEFAQMTDPVNAKRKVDEAKKILSELGFPRPQQNERSALTLLAALALTPDRAWNEAGNPLIGITPIMEFMFQAYGKKYAPNSRETVRRKTVHQFVQASLFVQNPDNPKRPTNSDQTVYQVGPQALKLLRSFGTPSWEEEKAEYVKQVGTLQEKYENARSMAKIPVKLPGGDTVALTPGGQNVLIKAIIEEFCYRFAPGGRVLYVGDSGDKFACFDEQGLKKLRVRVNTHGKMPDVIVFFEEKNWLLLIEAVTSHGPVDAKRHEELKQMFADSTAGLVFVTAFLTKKQFKQFMSEIAWETEVWIAENPTHMIHFNGERFLGPYPSA